MSLDCALAVDTNEPFNFSEFSEIPFPEDGNIVYVLFFKREGSSDYVPFYVGESGRHVGRFGDYVSAKFSASTDFKVGEAVRQLRDHGCKVIIRYKFTSNRRAEEQSIIQKLTANGLQLLNSMGGYKYLNANEHDERIRVKEFTTDILLKGHRPLTVVNKEADVTVE